MPKSDHLKCENCGGITTSKCIKSGKTYLTWFHLDNKRLCQKCFSKLSKKAKLWNKNKARIYRKKHPEKIIAHRIANNKKLRGNICERCGVKNTKFEMHHFDYSKPDKIITLCVKCHKDIHKIWG